MSLLRVYNDCLQIHKADPWGDRIILTNVMSDWEANHVESGIHSAAGD